jgi:hypothetical protein
MGIRATKPARGECPVKNPSGGHASLDNSANLIQMHLLVILVPFIVTNMNGIPVDIRFRTVSQSIRDLLVRPAKTLVMAPPLTVFTWGKAKRRILCSPLSN